MKIFFYHLNKESNIILDQERDGLVDFTLLEYVTWHEYIPYKIKDNDMASVSTRLLSQFL